MNGIDILVEEHDNNRVAVKKIREECIAILEGKEVDTAWFRQIVLFCRNYADKYHHGKEEKILFRIMVEELGTIAEKLIKNGMLVEHDLGRFYIGELENALQEYDKNPSAEWKLEIISNASAYASLLTRHMDKEDNAVFTFAEENLSDSSKQKVREETQLFEEDEEGNKIAIELLEWIKK